MIQKLIPSEYNFLEKSNDLTYKIKIKAIKETPLVRFLEEEYSFEYQIQDDELIEGISYKVYNTTDYWDVICYINGITDMDSLPKNNDIILKRVSLSSASKKEYLSKFRILNEVKEEDLVSQILDEENLKNENFRIIRLINPSDISEFIREFKKYFYENTSPFPNAVIPNFT